MGRVDVLALNKTGATGLGAEVWLLAAIDDRSERLALNYPTSWVRVDRASLGQSGLEGGAFFKTEAGKISMSGAELSALYFLAHAWSGMVQIDYDGQRHEIDLSRDEGQVVRVDPKTGAISATTPIEIQDVLAPELRQSAAPPRSIKRQTDNALSKLPRAASPYAPGRLDPSRPIALYLPRWKGVAMSTRALFDQTMELTRTDAAPEQLTLPDMVRYAEQLLVTGCRHFVVSGGDVFWHDLIDIVQAADPRVRFDLLWHSNYAQMGETHDWRLWQLMLEAHMAGKITRIGVVKEGYDRWLRGKGVDAVFIPNVLSVAVDAIKPNAHDGSVGVWLSGSSHYRKPVLPSLMALALSGKHALRGSGLGREGIIAAEQLSLAIAGVYPDAIPTQRLHAEMAETVATLYVTLSECSPMLPLESMALGVPCLVGPASHLFRHHPALRDWLIVETPMDAVAITRKLDRVVAERDAIISAYRDYAREELATALRSVERLLA
jgi:hypothetical protein